MPTWTFECPTIQDWPRLGGDKRDRLWRHYQSITRGINVFVLKDGTVAQDTATGVNLNSNVPYPIVEGPFAEVWNLGQYTPSFQTNPVEFIFYGGHHYDQVPDEIAQSLIAAGYTLTQNP